MSDSTYNEEGTAYLCHSIGYNLDKSQTCNIYLEGKLSVAVLDSGSEVSIIDSRCIEK